MFDLTNKTILLTGAGKGIGKDILEKLQEYNLIIYAIVKSKNDIKKITPNKNLYIINGDITNKKCITKVFNLIKKNKHRLDCLINNAGIRQRKKFLKINEKDLNFVFKNNFFSLFNLTQQFVKQFKFKKNHGSIINISSIVGELGFNELSGYASSKSAINGLTKCLAIELAKDKIRVNSIAPGFIKSSFYKKFKREKKKLYNWTLSRTPSNKWGELSDVSDLVVFLLSDNSKYINGQILKIDGGWTSA